MLLEEKKKQLVKSVERILGQGIYWYHMVDPVITPGCGRDAVETIEALYRCSRVSRDEDRIREVRKISQSFLGELQKGYKRRYSCF